MLLEILVENVSTINLEAAHFVPKSLLVNLPSSGRLALL